VTGHHPVHPPATARRILLATLGIFTLVAPPVGAQTTRWVVDTALSLAWWQMSPHMNHLWATTCPGDPSWRPGEGRGVAGVIPTLTLPTGYAAVHDTVAPLFPRKWVLPVCVSAVRGEIVTADTVRWEKTQGLIRVRADDLITGLDMRDHYARQAVMATANYPDIRFSIDSLTDVRPGDTLRATVIGVFEFRGVRRQVAAPAKAWHEAGGFRVTARFTQPPRDLVTVYGVPQVALGLGVGGLVWKLMYMGIDVILKRMPPEN
jgi:hypothetical protein